MSTSFSGVLKTLSKVLDSVRVIQSSKSIPSVKIWWLCLYDSIVKLSTWLACWLGLHSIHIQGLSNGCLEDEGC